MTRKKATTKKATGQPAAVHIAELATSDHPAAVANRESWDKVTKPKRRRRRRRRSNQLLSQRLVTEVNQKKRQFLREVGAMLTDALGFEVRVTLVPPKVALSPDQRRASRMTKAQARRQMAESMWPGRPGDLAELRAVINEPIRRHRAKKGIPGLDDGVGDL